MYEEKVAALGYEPVGRLNFDALLTDVNSANVKPDLVIIDRRSLGASHSPTELGELLGDIPYLMLADRDSDMKMDEHRLIHPGTLAKPFSSRALAHAIHDRIHLRAVTR